ncbi:MAG: sugar ABC transporter permease [Chloroflexi bacterium]|nr:sugar ABC transporter permease [Chloroflexota bacterium]
MKYNWRRRLAPYLFISPFFVGYAIFFAYPMVWALYLSFFKKSGVGSIPRFIGVKNYLNLLSDELFLKALGNTTYYAAGSIFLIVPAALGLALILVAPRLRWRELFRLLFFSPNITAGVVVAIIFRLVFEEDYGLINNYLLAPLGIDHVRWLREPLAIMPAIILMGLWHYTGVNALYFMAGLQNIPSEVKEAATIDGATRWQVFRYITLPLLRPVLIFVLTFAIIGSYNLFGEPSVLVGPEGGPRNAGLFMTMYLYLTGFRFLELGYASALGYALALIIFVLALLQMRILGVFRED